MMDVSLFFALRVQTRRRRWTAVKPLIQEMKLPMTRAGISWNAAECTHDEYTAIQEPGTSNSRDLRKQALTTGDTVRGE